jgi:transposase
LEAVKRFEQGERNTQIAVDLRVTLRSVERWCKAWGEQGAQGVLSRGPAARPRLSKAQFARLEAELRRGPLAHGFNDQRWTLERIKTLIGRLFRIGYTVQGVWKLLRRNGWSCQVPARRAIERDDEQIQVWKQEVWPQAERPRRTWAPGWSLRMRPAGRSGRPRPEPGGGAGAPR